MSEHASPGLPTINRSVVVLIPKVAFLEWAQASFQDGRTPPGLPSQPRAFLIPQASGDQEGRDYVLVECDRFFADMLANWNPDRSTWPGDLDSCSLFTAWFDIQIVVSVAEAGDA